MFLDKKDLFAPASNSRSFSLNKPRFLWQVYHMTQWWLMRIIYSKLCSLIYHARCTLDIIRVRLCIVRTQHIAHDALHMVHNCSAERTKRREALIQHVRGQRAGAHQGWMELENFTFGSKQYWRHGLPWAPISTYEMNTRLYIRSDSRNAD